jgi:hypothetical protein
MNLSELTDNERYARMMAFRWLAIKLRRIEKERGKKFSKNVRRRLALELDCEILFRIDGENNYGETNNSRKRKTN